MSPRTTARAVGDDANTPAAVATRSASTVRSAELAERASRVIPGGVNSPVRAYGSVGGTPRFLVSGTGPYVTDVDGNEYVDLVASWGPALLGHSHPAVIDAVQSAVARGLGFGASVPEEAELAEEIIARVGGADRVAGAGAESGPGAGSGPGSQPIIERLRLVSTGTEATMTAIRLARGATGRPLLVKFAGHYHGHSDGLLAEAGSGLATLAMPGSAGVTAETAGQTLVLPYNDVDALEAAFGEHGDRIAGVIAEAAACNMGVLPPAPGFTRAMIEVAHRHGALVILDEVLTGFRAGPAGYWGIARTETAGLAPDLMTFGKVVGGGLPLAALGGRADLMDLLAPLGPVYQAGTLSGNPVAVAAGLATMRHADAAAYDRLAHAAESVSGLVTAALSEAGVPHRLQRAGTLFSVLFGEFPDPPRTYAEVQQQNTLQHRAFFHAMLEGGVNLPPSAFEAWFVTAAHDDAAIERIASALPAAARAAAQV